MILTRKSLRFAQFALAIFVFTSIARAAGEVDTSFLANISGANAGIVNKILVQPDGKALVGGNFRLAGGQLRAGLFRLNADGSMDTGFLPPAFYTGANLGGTINTIALQADGKILVGGTFHGADGVSRPAIMRLNTNGSIDQSFTSLPPSGSTVVDIHILPDGRLLIAGGFTIADPGGNRVGIARLNSDGSLDSLVYQNIVAVSRLVPLADGRVVAGTATNVRRFNADGTFDPTFSTTTVSGGSVTDMILLADGKVLVSGGFTTVNGFTLRALFRVNVDGSVDGSFNGAANLNSAVNGITPTPSGKYLIFGSFTQYSGVARNRIALIDAGGVLDPSFHMPVNNFAFLDMAFLPDGRLLAGASNTFVRINTDGTIDNTFSLALSNTAGSAFATIVQPDGKIIAAGQFLFANGVSRSSLVRFNADGSLDTGFNPPGLSQSGAVYDLELQPDGKIIVPFWLGSSGFAWRLNPDGSFDTGFSNAGNSYDAEYLADGRILVANGDRVRRYNSDASTDGTWSVITGGGTIYEMIGLPDGKTIVVGTFSTYGGQNRGRIARLNADGNLDATFAPPGGANGNINTAIVEPDGKILIGGDFTGVNFDTNKKYLARLNADGSLDTSFAPTLNAPVLGIKRQSNGQLLIGGAFNFVNGNIRAGIVRLNSNGTSDLSFNTGPGTNSTVWSIDQQSDGKIIYVGQFFTTNGIATLGIGRLLNASAPARTLFDYDGDSKADVSVFRASENRWYIFRSSDSVVSQTAFAIAGDIPVPADYDGDLKTDVAIYRPSSGAWWYLSSLNGAQINVNWGGEAGDIPRPSDFDGDGKTDFVFFRPSNNFWYRITGTGTISNVQFGSAGDKPVRGDFDGDGKSDVAIFRPSTGDWWYQSSINNAQLAVRWGISTDIPAPADFDGDGKTDFAVYRPSTGVWYVINSSNGSFLIGPFGTPEDKPVPADYDGDGKAELAVFRPSTGIWYQLRTNGGFFAMQFGIGTDTPTPNAFVP